MKRQLKPIAGALIAGLVGFAQAQCYYETSYVCQNPDPVNPVAYVNYGPGNGWANWVPAYATTTWYLWNNNSTSSGYNLKLQKTACAGPATYQDPYTLQPYNLTTGNGLYQDYRVNYSSPCP